MLKKKWPNCPATLMVSHENKVAEIKVHIPGNDLFVKKQSETFESAIDQAIEALSIQVKKHKDKIQGN